MVKGRILGVSQGEVQRLVKCEGTSVKVKVWLDVAIKREKEIKLE